MTEVHFSFTYLFIDSKDSPGVLDVANNTNMLDIFL